MLEAWKLSFVGEVLPSTWVGVARLRKTTFGAKSSLILREVLFN